MTPERLAGLVALWVRLYTRDLPAAAARRRVQEIDADLHDQIAHGRAHGRRDRHIALGLLSRMVRGLAADASWRRHHARARPAGARGAAKRRTSATRSVAGIVGAAGAILLLPLVAMRFTDEVAWGPLDFALAGVLLVGTGLAFRVAARTAGSVPSRAAAGMALAGALVLVWACLAVGINGDTGDPADVGYAAVLAAGILGAVRARLRPHGMARALLAMALLQALVAVVALLAGRHEAPITSASEIVGVNAAFVALFAGSAWLFRRAARAGPAAGDPPLPVRGPGRRR